MNRISRDDAEKLAVQLHKALELPDDTTITFLTVSHGEVFVSLQSAGERTSARYEVVE